MKHFWLVFIVLLISACHKEEKITTDPHAALEFSSDTVFFDTLFTSVGSITKRLKVYNRNSEAVNIGSVELGGKATSPYTITIEGQETWFRNNVYLRGGDSLYILVRVTIDPRNKELPFLVPDSLLFTTNGNVQQVQLLAYGQDATFLTSSTVPCDTVWTNIKPFVIFDYLRIAPGCTLTLEKGVRLFFHDKATLQVEGTLIVRGTKDSLVTFTGDKLQKTYDNVAGQWQGIVFDTGSRNNRLEFCRIQNAVTGVSIFNDPSDHDTIPEVMFLNSVVKNMQKTGVEAFGTDVYACNSLFVNTVRSAFAGEGGGNYYFTQCTFATYAYDFFREEPVAAFSNSLTNEQGTVAGPLLARMINCIVWGDLTNELLLSEDGAAAFDFKAYSSILKTTRTDLAVNGNLINQNPLFRSPVLRDFHLGDLSPAINAGQPAGVSIDLDGKPRDAAPDIGAFEK